MYQILRKLRVYPYRKGASQWDKYAFANKGLDEKEFINYLRYSTSFLRDWRSTLFDWKWRLGLGNNGGSQSGVSRIQKTNHLIDLVLDGCRDKGYLEPKVKNQRLKLTDKGRRFSGFWKIGFLNEWFKEYGYINSFLFGSSAATTVFITFWENWKNLVFITKNIIEKILSWPHNL
jgi:hypothetical protein